MTSPDAPPCIRDVKLVRSRLADFLFVLWQLKHFSRKMGRT